MTTLDTTTAAEYARREAEGRSGRAAGGRLTRGAGGPVPPTGVGCGLPVLAVAGGTASGKSTLAKAWALRHAGAVAAVHLDDFYVPEDDPQRGVRIVSATGAVTLDWNHPGSIDEDAAAAAVDAAAASGRYRMVMVEGLFALALPKIAVRAAWRVYVDTPDDVRLARKMIRKIEIQHKDPLVSLRNYLRTGRDRHKDYVAPSRDLADLVLDGTTSTADLLTAVDDLVGPFLAPAR